MGTVFVDNIKHQSAQGSGTITIGASGETVAVASGSNFSTTGITDNATSTAVTIDSSQNVGIGTATPSNLLDVTSSGTPLNIDSTNDEVKKIQFKNSGAIVGYYGCSAGTPMRVFNGSGTEFMRIDSSGNMLIGKTTSSVENVGVTLFANGDGGFTRSSDVPLYVNRKTNDGSLVSFNQDNNQEGNITVSGATVSYNGFTGTHWSRFTDNSKPNILRGTILESLDEMCNWYNLEFDITDKEGNINTKKIPHILQDGQSDGDVINYNYEETDVQATIVKEGDIKHMMSKISDTVDAKNVYGVFSAYDEDGEGYNDFYVASVGSFVVRIKQGETVAKGDLLQSNGDGTAKVQTDDVVRSSSFAKVLSTTIIETYEDGSYLVPCSLMC